MALVRGLFRNAYENGYRKTRKLDPEKVRAARRMVDEGLSRAETARQLGVSSSAIESVISGQTWGWVQQENTD